MTDRRPGPATASAAPGRDGLRPTVRALAGAGALLLFLVPLAAVEVSVDGALTLTYKLLIDQALRPGHERVLLRAVGLLAGWVAGASLLAVYRDWLYARAITGRLAQLRTALFAKVLRLATAYWDQHGAATVLARFSTDLAGLETWLLGAVNGLLLPLLSVLMALGLLFWFLPWDLALVGAAVWPLALFGPRLVVPRAAAADYERRDLDAALLGSVVEVVGAQRVVRVYGLEDWTAARFHGFLQPLRRGLARTAFLSAMVERSTVVAIYAVQTAGVAGGALLVHHGLLTIGTFVAFVNVFWNLGWSLVVLARGAPGLVAARSCARRLDELLAAPEEVASATDQTVARLQESIRFEGVGFGYPGRPEVLADLSIEIRAGEFVAVVGPNGAGKSSLLNLLVRCYDPTAGAVLLDGTDLRELSVAEVRRQMGVVFQDTVLFAGTVADNIRVGRPDADAAAVEAAAREAEVHDAILALPQGYATPLGTGGRQLSGGQRQRLALARALVRQPALLLLDEATSALDPPSEAAVAATLVRAGRGRTTICITHRLAAITEADRILVLQAGRLAESGTHAALLAADGLYAELWRKQAGLVVSEDGTTAAVSPERLRALPLLAQVEEELLARLATRFVSQRVAAGEVICREGDPGDLFYLIARGAVLVTRLDESGRPVELARLGEGDQFGEVALWLDTPRNATVTATSDGLLLALTRRSFAELLAGSPVVREAVARLVETRGAAANTAEW